MLRKLVALFVVVSCPIITTARADDSGSCTDALRYASRNYINQVSYSDQRKFFYKAVCEASGTSLGLDYRSADVALGLNYTSKDDYCSHEKSYDQATQYDQRNSSIVVEQALETFLQCRALKDAGIEAKLTVPAGEVTVFEVKVTRVGSNQASVTSVTIDDPNAVACKFKGAGNSRATSGTHTDVDYSLPNNSGTWSLACVRKTVVSAGVTTYPRVKLIVGTSAGTGGFPISLDEVGLATGAWANDLKKQVAGLNARVDGVRLSVKDSSTVRHNPIGENLGCEAPNQFVNWFEGDQSFGGHIRGFRCATLELVVPPQPAMSGVRPSR
ncbi:hypothetical protein AB7M63_003647 [Bradyrhizobium japonicum]